METVKKHKYHYFYKITNKINNHFYYGIHSTDNVNDGYMGSGTLIKMAYSKYGTENFEKEIVRFFNTREEASQYESEIVSETTIKDSSCYNMITGGDKVFPCIDMVTVFDKALGIHCLVHRDEYEKMKDKRYFATTAGKVLVKEKNNDGIRKYVTQEEFRDNREKYITCVDNLTIVKDKDGNAFRVNSDDERLKNGELTLYWTGLKHSNEWKDKVRKTFAKIGHQRGEKNSQYGTKWVNKNGIAKKIKKDELHIYVSDGWDVGRIRKTTKLKRLPAYMLIDDKHVNALHESGNSWSEIARLIGVSENVIREYLRWKKYGYIKKPKNL